MIQRFWVVSLAVVIFVSSVLPQSESEQTKGLEHRLNAIGALIGVPVLVMGFLSINLYG